ncbi:zinc-binding dehydrogenase [Paenarthrobacter sp. NPDC091711]|uniref:zinc-binding dehydrogenase n=1 Tax=Paenarthrobacter sp. NPDC091711 TaxID=3364385 RepID=UPI00380E782F
MGLAGVLAAKASGASKIVVVEPNKYRRELALSLGATHAVNPGPDVVEEIKDTAGALDCTLDTTGASEAIRAAVGVLRPLGRCGVVSWRTADPVIGPMDLVMEGRSLIGICEGGAQPAVFIPQMLQMWRSGDFPFDRLIQTFPFSEIDQAERASRDGSVIKPVLVM